MGGVLGGVGGSICSTHWSYVSSSLPLPVSSSCVPLPSSSQPLPASNVPVPASHVTEFSSILSQIDDKRDKDSVKENLSLLRKHLKYVNRKRCYHITSNYRLHVEELDAIRESLLKRLGDSIIVQSSSTSTNQFIATNSFTNVNEEISSKLCTDDTSDSLLMTCGAERSDQKDREPSAASVETVSMDSDSSSDLVLTDNEKEKTEDNQKEQSYTTHLNMSPSLDYAPNNVPTHDTSLKSPSRHQSLTPSPTRPQKSSPLLKSLRSPSPPNNSSTLHAHQTTPSPINLQHSSPLHVCIPPSHSSPVSHITPSPTPSPTTNDDTVEEEEEPFNKELTISSNGEEEIPEEEEEGKKEEEEEEGQREEEQGEEEKEEQGEEDKGERESEEEDKGERESEEEEEVEVEEIKGIVLNESILDEMLQDKDENGVNLNASINTSSSISPLKNGLNEVEDIATLVNSPHVKVREDDELNQTLLSSDLEERNEVQRILQTLLKKPPNDDDDHSLSTDDGNDGQVLSSVSPTLDTSDSTTIREEHALGQCSDNDSPSESDESLNDDAQKQSLHRR